MNGVYLPVLLSLGGIKRRKVLRYGFMYFFIFKMPMFCFYKLKMYILSFTITICLERREKNRLTRKKGTNWLNMILKKW